MIYGCGGNWGRGVLLRSGATVATITSGATNGHDFTVTGGRIIRCDSGQEAYYKLRGGPFSTINVSLRQSHSNGNDAFHLPNGDRTLWTFFAASGAPLFRIHHRSNVGLVLDYHNGAAWVNGPAFGSALPMTSSTVSVWRHEFHLADVGGFVRVYRDNVLVGAIEGDTLLAPDAAGGLDALLLGPGPGYISGPYFTGSTAWYSEIIHGTSALAGRRVYTAPWTGDAGTTNTMASGTVANISEATLSPDGLISDAAGQKATFPVTMPTVIPNASVEAFVLSTYSMRGENGPTGQRAVTRIGGVDHLAPVVAVPEGMDEVQHVMNVSPATGVSWTPAGLPTEFGFQTVA